MKNIFITGGHYTPAAAVIEELLQNGDWCIYYVGKTHSFEGDSAVSYEFLELKNNPQIIFLNITAGRLQPRFGENIFQSFRALLKTPVGLAQSIYWIIKHNPKIVLSFGGYIALPVVIAAWLLGIPVVTHEQTKVFGLANRIIQSLADKICVSFESTLPQDISSKWIWTGNPLRKDTLNVNESPQLKKIANLKKKSKFPVIYVTGGKQGSHAINEEVLKDLPELVNNFILVLQTGDNRQYDDFGKANDLIATLPDEIQNRILVSKFFSSGEIGAVFNLSDVVVSRSGANIVFDLAVTGKPSILIPLPSSRGNEQFLNAKELESRGLAKILEQKNIEILPKEIRHMVKSLTIYQKNKQLGRDLIVTDSAKKIVDIITSASL